MRVTSDKIKNFPDGSKIKLKLYFEAVEDKPGYYWFNKRNYQIISEETLMEALKKYENNIT